MNNLPKMFYTFFKIGMFTIGGGYAMLPLIQKEVVEKNAWIEEKEFFELLALAQSSPGPIAVNSAVFIGYKQAGIIGSLVATLAIVLPSFLAILVIAAYLVSYRDNATVTAVFKGLRPAVVALIAAPLYSLAKSMNIGLVGLIVAVVAAVAIAFANVSPIAVIIMAAAAGLINGIKKAKVVGV